MGYPAAFVGQNGASKWTIPWADFDALFLGGSPECLRCNWVRPATAFRVQRCISCDDRLTEWKLGAVARELTAEAKARGLWVHMGRVNSKKRLVYAQSIGCDSADGTYLAFGPTKNAPKLAGWLQHVATLPPYTPAHILEEEAA